MKIKFLNSHKFYLNLVLQRTGHFTDITGAAGKAALSEWMETGDSDKIIQLLKNQQVLQEYLQICTNSANKEAFHIFELLLKNGLSLENANVLSIGCGNGLVELMLFHIAKKNNQKIKEFNLVDAEDSSNVKGLGYQNEAASYASLPDTLTFLTQNDVDSKISLYNPYKNTLPLKNITLFTLYLPWDFTFL